MAIEFFWYNGKRYHGSRWGMRGIAFIDEDTSRINVHYVSLFFLQGATLKHKLAIGCRAWKWLIRGLYREIRGIKHSSSI